MKKLPYLLALAVGVLLIGAGTATLVHVRRAGLCKERDQANLAMKVCAKEELCLVTMGDVKDLIQIQEACGQ